MFPLLASAVTPSRSFTTVSYCSRVMRGICVVAGMPGMQTHMPTHAGALPPVPPTCPSVSPEPVPAVLPDARTSGIAGTGTSGIAGARTSGAGARTSGAANRGVALPPTCPVQAAKLAANPKDAKRPTRLDGFIAERPFRFRARAGAKGGPLV